MIRVQGNMSVAAQGLRYALSLLRAEPSHSRILGGSLVMLVGSGVVSLANFGFNVAVARMLGPSGFGHAAAAVTLLMLVSSITLAFQLVCAKLVARGESPGAIAAVYSLLLRRAWLVGILLGSLLFVSRGVVTRYLNLPSPTLMVLLAASVAFHIPLGVRRGGLQGVCKFGRLSFSFVLEALFKFAGAIALIHLGYGVTGVVGAIAGSVVLAYFLPLTPSALKARPEAGQTASYREGIQAIVFFVGQVIINNVDILLVKHFFDPGAAGLYAAVALVGRVVYLLSWSVVSAMFPVSAGAKHEEYAPSVLVLPLILVLAIAVIFISGLSFFPNFALRTVFGPAFYAEAGGLASLLMLYAAATGVYSLAVVLMAYEMSRKLANSGYVQLSFSGALVIGISIFHHDLRQVVVVQLVLMVFLLIASALPFFRPPFGARGRQPSLGAPETVTGLVRLREVTEAEVVAEFLRSEYHHSEFDPGRERFEPLVAYGDIRNETENALRRALLFRRRGTMWRELPTDTRWWEVELSPEGIEKLRVFPRAQWRRLASGSFLLSDLVQRIRTGQFTGRTAAFLDRMRTFSEQLRSHPNGSSILLIGIDDWQPFTILEGNHRVTAAMLVSPELVKQRFRFYCGFSPRMTECCWYQTNLATLYRYARNRLKLLIFDREADLARLMATHHEREPRTGSATPCKSVAPVPDDPEMPTQRVS